LYRVGVMAYFILAFKDRVAGDIKEDDPERD
jgi:hypothetical protein